MKTFDVKFGLFMLFTLTSLGLPPSALGEPGGAEGHGAGVLVCRDEEDERVLRRELLDLAESPAPILRRDDLSVQVQIDRAMKRLRDWNPGFARYVEKALKEAKEIRRKPPAGYTISPPTDAKIEFTEENCQLNGVAKWKDAERVLYIDDRALNRLSFTDQAAVFMHEAIYKVLRRTERATDSIHTRQIVGYLFTDLPMLVGSTFPAPRPVPFCREEALRALDARGYELEFLRDGTKSNASPEQISSYVGIVASACVSSGTQILWRGYTRLMDVEPRNLCTQSYANAGIVTSEQLRQFVEVATYMLDGAIGARPQVGDNPCDLATFIRRQAP